MYALVQFSTIDLPYQCIIFKVFKIFEIYQNVATTWSTKRSFFSTQVWTVIMKSYHIFFPVVIQWNINKHSICNWWFNDWNSSALFCSTVLHVHSYEIKVSHQYWQKVWGQKCTYLSIWYKVLDPTSSSSSL